MQLALICNGMRGRSAGRFDIGFREISSYEQHVQYVIFSPISRYSFSGAGSRYARTCVGPAHGRFARSDRARRDRNRCRALNYRRLSESSVVTGANGNRHPRLVERHIRKRSVLRVCNFFASVNTDATTHRLWQVISRPIIDCGGCHGVREVVSHPTPSAVEAGNDKTELAMSRNAMSQAGRVPAVARVGGRTSKPQATPAIRKRTSDCPVHRNLTVSCMRNDISRIFVSRSSTRVA